MGLKRKLDSFRKRNTLKFRGLKIRRKDGFVTPRLWKRLVNKTYEIDEIRAAARHIVSSDRILELGGGLGISSAAVAKETSVSRIVLFEANPELISYIRELHAENEITNVDVHNAILTHDGDGEVVFYICDHFTMSSLDDRVPYSKIVKVPTRNANTVISECSPTVIICDIEGGEVELFDERCDLSGVRLVIMELHGNMLGSQAVSDVFQNMHGHGFTYCQRGSVGAVVVFERIESAAYDSD